MKNVFILIGQQDNFAVYDDYAFSDLESRRLDACLVNSRQKMVMIILRIWLGIENGYMFITQKLQKVRLWNSGETIQMGTNIKNTCVTEK